MAASNLQEHLADENAHVQYVREDVLQLFGDIIYAGVDAEPTRLPVEQQGNFVLVVSVDTPHKPIWQYIGLLAVPTVAFLHKGDLLVGTGQGTYAVLTAGTTGQVLTVDPTTLTGLIWATPAVVITCPYGLDFSYECDSGYVAVI